MGGSMIRTLVLLIAFMALPAHAGSITITYKNDAGGTLYTPNATISNADAAKFVTWCQKNYAGNPLSVTAQGCFNVWANDWFNQMKASVNGDLGDTAAAAAKSGITPIVVTPAQ